MTCLDVRRVFRLTSCLISVHDRGRSFYLQCHVPRFANALLGCRQALRRFVVCAAVSAAGKLLKVARRPFGNERWNKRKKKRLLSNLNCGCAWRSLTGRVSATLMPAGRPASHRGTRENRAFRLTGQRRQRRGNAEATPSRACNAITSSLTRESLVWDAGAALNRYNRVTPNY